MALSGLSFPTEDEEIHLILAALSAASKDTPLLTALRNNWVVDIGATISTTINRDVFVGDLRPYNGKPILGIGGHRVMP